MKIKTKKILALLTLMVFFVPVFASADAWGWNVRSGQKGNLAGGSIQDKVTSLLLWLLGILAVLSVIGFVGSGIMYITAGGGAQKETAKKWLMGTIIGLVVALSSYVIVYTIDQIFSQNGSSSSSRTDGSDSGNDDTGNEDENNNGNCVGADCDDVVGAPF